MPDWRDLSIREIEELLEEWSRQALAQDRAAAPGSKKKGVADKKYQQYSSYLLSLRRLTVFLAESAPTVAPARFHTESCPWCGRRVSLTEEPVWVCPADVRPDAPGWLPPANPRLRGTAFKCGRLYGLKCYPDVPAHGECQKRG